jgi:hypothetical protein
MVEYMSEYDYVGSTAAQDSIEKSIANSGLVDLSSEGAPDYLSGNVRRVEAEKARQERKMKRMEEEELFFENLINNILIPKGLVTEKEKGFIFLNCTAAKSKNFWETWLSNYNLSQNLNGSKPMKSYMENEFHESPTNLLEGKMGSLPENIFDLSYYLEKLARFAADFQTEWKTAHFSIKKNESGANVLIEESNTARNLEAERIVYQIWDLMNEFNEKAPKIIDYYNSVNKEISGHPIDSESMNEIYTNVFKNPKTAKSFESARFELLTKYVKLLFAVKDNWEMRLERKYEGFTDFKDVENTIHTFLEKRLEIIGSMFEE